MEDFFIVSGDHPYHQTEPQSPVDRSLWATEEEGYIKVFAWMNGEWNLVIEMEPLSNESVKVTYTDEDNVTEEIELLDYQYRIGVL